MTSDANGVYRGVYTYREERISVRDLVEVEGVPNDPLYYMYDGRGSVTQLTNAVGNVRDKYRYTPFGEPMSGGELSPNTKLLNNPYGYNGEYHDLESGFQYLRARYYNPETARFITRDSYLGEINEPLSLNRYAYTSNNPVMNVDPSGNVPESSSDDINLNNQIKKDYLREKSNSPVKNQPLLKLGSRGDAVVKVQKILDEQGYYLGSSGVDGVYGKYTYEAVEAYQTRNGLQVDGKVGPETWGSFNSYVNKKAAESKGRSKNSKGCGDVDAVSSVAMGMGNIVVNDNVNMYTKDEASKYINGGVFGVYNTILNKDAISNLPKIVSYKDNGYSYDYVLSQHTETWFGGQITIPGEYSYELVYTDKPKVLTGTIYIGGLGVKGAGKGPYSHLDDPASVGTGKDFTAAQKKNIIEENMKKNGGVVKSDLSGQELVKPSKSQKGVTPPENEWQIDHINAKDNGGSNSYSNAQVLSRKENRLKSNK